MVKILQQLKLWLSVVIMPTRNLTHFIGYTYTFPRVLFFFFLTVVMCSIQLLVKQEPANNFM